MGGSGGSITSAKRNKSKDVVNEDHDKHPKQLVDYDRSGRTRRSYQPKRCSCRYGLACSLPHRKNVDLVGNSNRSDCRVQLGAVEDFF